MATLLFSAVGTLFGGPLGGAIGALVGRSLDKAILGSPSREGARLKELSVSTSSYGSPVPRLFGRMRTAGTIIWSTDLVEQKEKQGGGKGKPSYTTYNYSASLAIALSSRPLQGIGRIWADGNLLRGASGDMKTGGQFRFHNGHGDQNPDSLLLAAEGLGQCPAYRDMAYVVFEDLHLGDFGNRIPALTFEVFADDGAPTAQDLFDDIVDDVSAAVQFPEIEGLSCEGPLADLLSQLDLAYPLDCNVSGETLTIWREGVADPTILSDPAISVADGAFGVQQGFARKRLPPLAARPGILRYYDVDRDYQPGLQRAPGRPAAGQPGTVDLPVAMTAANARQVCARLARRTGWARQSLSWRSAQLDTSIVPGSMVRMAGEPGIWRVEDWEWREGGVEMSLSRISDAGMVSLPADPGRSNAPMDTVAGATVLQAFELPWDGTGTGDGAQLFAAASSSSPGWPGAALFVDRGDGQLLRIGSTGRARAVMGSVASALPPASPEIFDRGNHIDVDLVDPAAVLVPVTMAQLASGANRALVGRELLQFKHTEALGGGIWRLSGLLRGRGGTEAAIGNHGPGESFVLLDGEATELDAVLVGDQPGSRIAAIGLAEDAPVLSDIACRGIARRPLCPIRPKWDFDTAGALHLRWTRRARGAWVWADGVDVPLNEEAENYVVTLEAGGARLAMWATAQPELAISAGELAALQPDLATGTFVVRQQGKFALSDGLALQLTN
ncbi:phage tail protein [Novosphingobium sp.]|uniref:phage tail protein n=1 Tax=Novosphingobium sp. TaxID=1874826 RepID=UPI00286E7C9F|nr:phage tail protein [Novosphingobium sp.]